MDFPFETSCCTVSEEGYMLWNSTGYGSDRTGNAYFILTDSTGTILQTAVEKQFKSGYSLGDPRNVYTFQGKNYAYSPFNLSVWKIENDSIQKDVQFSLGNPSPPYSFLMEKATVAKVAILRHWKSLIIYHTIQSGNLLNITVSCISFTIKDSLDFTTNTTSFLIYMN